MQGELLYPANCQTVSGHLVAVLNDFVLRPKPRGGEVNRYADAKANHHLY